MTGTELRAARLRLGWTPEQMAKACRVSRSLIYQAEAGSKPISAPLALLVDIFDTGIIPRPAVRGEAEYEKPRHFHGTAHF